MKYILKNWWKILLLSCVFGMMNMTMHAFLSPADTSNVSQGESSYFIKTNTFMHAIIVWEILAYSTFTIVFSLIQQYLPGNRHMKGFLYGLAFAGLYAIGMFESALLTGTSFIYELKMGLTDGASMIVMGLLLGHFLAYDSTKRKEPWDYLANIFIPIIYVIGRYFSYTVIHIKSVYSTYVVETLVWTVLIGIWLGVMYNLLKSALHDMTRIRKAIVFGCVIYGLNWVLNNIFMLAVYEFTWDLFIRSSLDAIYVTLAIFIALTMNGKKSYR